MRHKSTLHGPNPVKICRRNSTRASTPRGRTRLEAWSEMSSLSWFIFENANGSDLWASRRTGLQNLYFLAWRSGQCWGQLRPTNNAVSNTFKLSSPSTTAHLTNSTKTRSWIQAPADERLTWCTILSVMRSDVEEEYCSLRTFGEEWLFWWTVVCQLVFMMTT